MKIYRASTKVELHMLLEVEAENEEEVKALMKGCMQYEHDGRGLRAFVHVNEEGRVKPIQSTYFIWENDPTLLVLIEKDIFSTKEVLDNRDAE